VRVLLFLALLAVPPAAQEHRESRDPQTVRYKDLPEIVRDIAADASQGDKAFVVWLVDNASMLKTAKQGEFLAGAVARAFSGTKVNHAVVAFGERPRVVLKATEDLSRVSAAIEGLAAARPDDALKNCLLNVREAAKVAAGASGAKKLLVLFTQENGDNEDDVEGTLKFLKSSGVSLYPIAPEALYSDPYWESALSGTMVFFEDQSRFRKLKFQLRGPESAYLEFPYGWPYTMVDPAYTVPSGFGYWALDRLATHSGGKYFLYTAEKSPLNFCQRYGCPLCGGQHKACGATFDVAKLSVTAPQIGSRAEYLARRGRDKLFLACLAAWERLNRANVLRGTPPLRGGAGALSENNRPDKPAQGLFGDDWKAIRQGALRAIGDVEKTAVELRAVAEKLGKDSEMRDVAAADALGVHLRMLVEVYRQLVAFCEEMDRVVRTRRPAASDGVASSALEGGGGKQVAGFSYHNVFLCHGGAALKEVKFLGDPAGLHAALDHADGMIEKHRGTPWEVLMRRAYLPVFTPFYEIGEGREATTRRTKSSSSTSQVETPATPARPQRPAQGTESGSAGTSTGNR